MKGSKKTQFVAFIKGEGKQFIDDVTYLSKKFGVSERTIYRWKGDI